MRIPLFAALILLVACLASPNAFAQRKPVELPGAKDHPMIGRYSGSVLDNTSDEHFVAIRVPAGVGRYGAQNALVFDKSVNVEGRVSGYFYGQPKDRSALEVFRNYQTALQQAGFATLYTCEMKACDTALIESSTFRTESVRDRKWKADRIDPGSFVERDVRFISAKASRNGADVYVMVYVAEPNSLWELPVAVVLVAEPAAMESGKVVVTTEKLQRGLADEGKIVLYGIYFDTGKSDIKPESKSQLDEMARLLSTNKALKVLVVGHTDNQGSIESNLTLSQRRAEAVVSALVTTYKVDAGRLRARGVANFSPTASNKAESGREKNRRVELVEQ